MSSLSIAAVRLLCPDPDRTAVFYERAFGCGRDEVPGGIALRLGSQRLELVPAGRATDWLAPSNATAFQHCAIIVSDMDAAFARLGGVPGWTAISRAGPEQLPASSGGVRAFKFRDPDGHPLELLAFPPDAVPDRWQGVPGLFLGIDHTAVTVADTERAVAFYARFGFTVASRNVNRGDAQARMDAVDPAEVEVTGLVPADGALPHLELLRYRQPAPWVRAVADDDPLATRIVFRAVAGAAERASSSDVKTDPDGHRFIVGP